MSLEHPDDLDEEELADVLLGLELLRRAPKLEAPRRARVERLLARTRDELAERRTAEPAFRMTLPLEVTADDLPPEARPKKPRAPGKPPFVLKLAPSLNEYAGLDPWVLEKARVEVDRRIALAKAANPRWSCGSIVETPLVTVHRKVNGKPTTKVLPRLKVTGGDRRLVRLVRHSSREIDEPGIDLLGGKILVDRLVWAGVLAGDSPKHLLRRARWVPAPPKAGFLTLLVYDLPVVPVG